MIPKMGRNGEGVNMRNGFLLVVVLMSVSTLSTAADMAGGDVSPEGYLVGPQDVLEISVWKEEDLSKTVLVRPDGKLSFPLIGDIQAGGKTPDQIRREITEWLRKYIPDPVVTVIVSKVAALKIYLIGEVKKAGEYTIGRQMDVIQALALAGGLTSFASENDIKILRRRNGKSVIIPFEYGAFKKGKKLEQNILLKSGDVVLVP